MSTRKPPASGELTPKQRCFVDEYLVDMNATQAAVRAGYSARTAPAIGAENLTKPYVAAAISAAQSARSERTKITQDDVLRRWLDITDANANDLIEYRRTCCRWCYGDGYRYQRTAGELARDRAAHVLLAAKATEDKPVPPFDEQGGAGYDRRKAPHPDCPECFGEGIGDAFLKDTRSLATAARRLYAGVKLTKEGLEVKLRDQDGALANVAKHLGMFVEKVQNNVAVRVTFVRESKRGNGQ